MKLLYEFIMIGSICRYRGSYRCITILSFKFCNWVRSKDPIKLKFYVGFESLRFFWIVNLWDRKFCIYRNFSKHWWKTFLTSCNVRIPTRLFGSLIIWCKSYSCRWFNAGVCCIKTAQLHGICFEKELRLKRMFIAVCRVRVGSLGWARQALRIFQLE